MASVPKKIVVALDEGPMLAALAAAWEQGYSAGYGEARADMLGTEPNPYLKEV